MNTNKKNRRYHFILLDVTKILTAAIELQVFPIQFGNFQAKCNLFDENFMQISFPFDKSKDN